MLDTMVIAPEAPTPEARLRRRPAWWLQASAAFAVSRLVSTALWLLVIRLARPGSRIGLHSSLIHAMAAWDGQWYELVARSGYPDWLPRGAGGVVEANPWAFLPAYPWLADAFTFGHARLWPAAAELVSTAFGFGAAVLLALLLRPHVGDRGAQRAVWLFALSPVAFILQAAYAEAMGMFLLLAALCLIDRHRYLAAIAPTVVLAFTRPGVPAIALAVALHLAVRWSAARRGGAPLTRGELLRGLTLVAVAALAAFAWGWIAAAATGVPAAYLDTELAWRLGWMGPQPFVPVVSWLFAARFWFGPWGPLAFGLALALFTALLISRPLRRCGPLVVAWTLAWGLYLLGVFFPQSSTFRLLIPMAPAGGVLAGVRSRLLVAAVLVGAVALQALWLYRTFGGWQYFWTVP